MKFFHLSDLHIGKHLYYYSLIEDQRHVLSQVIEMAKRERPDAVLLSGDIYDKQVPSAEAVHLFDWFLTNLSAASPGISVLIIAGNHDSGGRLEFAGDFLEKAGIHIAGLPPREEGERMKKVSLRDEFGEVHFYLLPFTKPSYVRARFGEERIESYEHALARLLEEEPIDSGGRNVLLSHQFYTAGGEDPKTCDSEIRMAGGIDQVDTSILKTFDYAALGHIHRAQRIGREEYRYAGTLLKYSVSEAGHQKSFTIVEMGKKGETPRIRQIPVSPLRDLRALRGTLQEVLEHREAAHDFVSVTLTDEEEPYLPKERLELVFDHILEIRIDNARTRKILEFYEEEEVQESVFSSFASFFQVVQGRAMNREEETMAEKVWNRIAEGGEER